MSSVLYLGKLYIENNCPKMFSWVKYSRSSQLLCHRADIFLLTSPRDWVSICILLWVPSHTQCSNGHPQWFCGHTQRLAADPQWRWPFGHPNSFNSMLIRIIVVMGQKMTYFDGIRAKHDDNWIIFRQQTWVIFMVVHLPQNLTPLITWYLPRFWVSFAVYWRSFVSKMAKIRKKRFS